MLIIDLIIVILLVACAILFAIGCITGNSIFLLIIVVLLVISLLLNGLEAILWEDD